MCVLSASQPRGTGLCLKLKLQTRLAKIAVKNAVSRVCRQINRLGSASAARTPSKPVFGKRRPADTSGEAQPIVHSGGTTVSAMATATVQARTDSRGVQQILAGSDRIA